METMYFYCSSYFQKKKLENVMKQQMNALDRKSYFLLNSIYSSLVQQDSVVGRSFKDV